MAAEVSTHFNDRAMTIEDLRGPSRSLFDPAANCCDRKVSGAVQIALGALMVAFAALAIYGIKKPGSFAAPLGKVTLPGAGTLGGLGALLMLRGIYLITTHDKSSRSFLREREGCCGKKTHQEASAPPTVPLSYAAAVKKAQEEEK